MIQRRSFLAGILAAGVAPAFVRAGVLMPVKEIWVPPVEVIVLTDIGLETKLFPMEIGRIETFRFIESPNYHRVMRPLGKSKPKAPDGEYFAFLHSDRAREYPFA